MNELDFTQIDEQGGLYNKLRQALVDQNVSDVSIGAVMSQLNIDAMAVIHKIMTEEVTSIQAAWTMLSDGFDPNVNYDEEAVRNILSNVLRTHTGGSVTYGRVRLIFDSNASRHIPNNTPFIAADGRTFVPRGAYILLPGTEYVRAGSVFEVPLVPRQDGRFEVLVELGSAENGAFPIVQGTIFSVNIPGLISAMATASFTAGRSDAAITSMIQEVPATLGEMSYNSPAGIRSLLQQRFPSIGAVKCLRSGNRALIRDRRNPFGMSSRAGDIYVVTATTPQVTRLQVTAAVMLECDSVGRVFNGGAYMGSLAAGSADTIDIKPNSFLTVTAQLRGRDVVGLYYPVEAGVYTDKMPLTPSKTAGAPLANNISIVSREVYPATEYGQVFCSAVSTDVAFSALQRSVTCSIELPLLDMSPVVESLYAKVTAWFSYWRGYFNNASSAQLSAYAAELGEPTSAPDLLSLPVPVYADVVYLPLLHDVQTDVSSSDNRAWGADLLIRAPHLAQVSVVVSLSHSLKSIRPRERHIRTRIANYINGFGLGAYDVPLQPIFEIIKEQSVVDADRNINLDFTTRVMTNDSQWYELNSPVLAAYEVPDKGMTADTTLLFCSPDNVAFIYR